MHFAILQNKLSDNGDNKIKMVNTSSSTKQSQLLLALYMKKNMKMITSFITPFQQAEKKEMLKNLFCSEKKKIKLTIQTLLQVHIKYTFTGRTDINFIKNIELFNTLK